MTPTKPAGHEDVPEDGFRPEDFSEVATRLRFWVGRGTAHEPDVRAVLSNNFNVILAALDRAKAPAQATELAPDVKGLVERLRKGHEAITPAPGARYYHVPPTALELEAADALSRLSAPPAEATRDAAEFAKLVGFFNEPAAFAKWGNDGDHDFLSPADTAIRALRKVLDTGPPPAEAKPVAWSVKPLEWRKVEALFEERAATAIWTYQIWWSENPGTVYTLRTPDGTLQFGSLEEARAAGLADCAVRTASLLEAHPDPRGLYQDYFDLDAADAAMKASHDGQPLQETFAAYKAGPLEADALLKWYAWQTSVAAPHPRAKAAEAVPEGTHDYRALLTNALTAVRALDDYTAINEVEWDASGENEVPPLATFWRVKSGQALKALDELRPSMLGAANGMAP